MKVDNISSHFYACVEFCFLKKEFLKLTINMQLLYFITPHAQRERGKVIDLGVVVYVCGQKIYLNRTLAIDLPFQTFAVGLLVEFIDWF